MDKEVDPKVLAVIEERRLSGPRLTPVEIIAKMGVLDAREKPLEYAWVATGNNVIATIWAEYVSTGSGGRWFYLESLDTQHRIGGGARTFDQVQRAKSRLELLKRTFDAGQRFWVVLQTNRVPIGELESNKSAKVSVRVRDDDEWHVASWNFDQQLAVLVRGPLGWAPTEEEVQAARARQGAARQDEPGLAVGEHVSQEALQAAALDYAIRHFTGYGYSAKNVAGQSLGYDIEVSNAKGTILLRVVVKGTCAGMPSFQLASDERACSEREPLWRLLAVTDALGSAAQHKIYKASEMSQAPGLEPGG